MTETTSQDNPNVFLVFWNSLVTLVLLQCAGHLCETSMGTHVVVVPSTCECTFSFRSIRANTGPHAHFFLPQENLWQENHIFFLWFLGTTTPSIKLSHEFRSDGAAEDGKCHSSLINNIIFLCLSYLRM